MLSPPDGPVGLEGLSVPVPSSSGGSDGVWPGFSSFVLSVPVFFSEAAASLRDWIRHECVHEGQTSDYKLLSLVALNDTAGIVLALVIDFSSNHNVCIYAPGNRSEVSGAVDNSVYVCAYEMLVVNQRIVVAVAASPVFLTEACRNVASLVIAVIFFHDFQP